MKSDMFSITDDSMFFFFLFFFCVAETTDIYTPSLYTPMSVHKQRTQILQDYPCVHIKFSKKLSVKDIIYEIIKFSPVISY